MVQIKETTFRFLKDLKINNNREWFNKNRNRYIEARENYESFLQALINEIVAFDPILKGLEAKSCTYRINRDIRFSNDKTIYKTHFGAFIVRGGRKNGDRFAGYYLHIEPGNNNMIAGGAYLPPLGWLSDIRVKIDEQGENLVRIITNKEFVKHFGKIDGDRLKTSPRGYNRDHPYIEFLRMKSFLATRMISDTEVIRSDFFELIISASKAMKPFNDFLNDY